MAQKTLFDEPAKPKRPEYVELDSAAQEQVNIYQVSRRLKREHDRNSRNHANKIAEALAKVKEQLDGATIAVLPDGRMVRLITHERKRKAQPASEFSFDELDVTPF